MGRSFYRTMLEQVLERIERRLKAVGLTAAAASKRAGLSVDAIRNMRRAAEKGDRQGISTRTIQALAPVLQTSVGWLLDGRGPAEISPGVPIIGKVGATPDGSIVLLEHPDEADLAPVPPGDGSNAVALEVQGHSMRGVADDGALIYFEDQRRAPTQEMLGQVVVCETEGGQTLVKRLLRGSAPGLYDLESLNGPTLTDQRLAWAAYITALIPPPQAKRLIIRRVA